MEIYEYQMVIFEYQLVIWEYYFTSVKPADSMFPLATINVEVEFGYLIFWGLGFN